MQQRSQTYICVLWYTEIPQPAATTIDICNLSKLVELLRKLRGSQAIQVPQTNVPKHWDWSSPCPRCKYGDDLHLHVQAAETHGVDAVTETHSISLPHLEHLLSPENW